MSSLATAATLSTPSATSPTSAPGSSTFLRARSNPAAPTSPTPTATTARASLPLQASLIYWPRSTPTKPREAAKHERPSSPGAHSLPSLPSFRGSHLRCLRFPLPPPPQGPHQVHPLVAVPFSRRRHRHWLGHVPLFPLNFAAHIPSANELTVFFSECYRHKAGPR